MKFNSTSLEETKKIAFDIIKNNKHKYILLDGQMGSGKTTLVKYMAQALGETKTITSPTFNIMKVYDKLIHIDAYKLSGNLSEFEDYFEDKLVVIEWSKNLNEIPKDSLKIEVSFNDDIHIYETK